MQVPATRVKIRKAKLIDKMDAIRAKWSCLMNSRFRECPVVAVVRGIKYSRGYYAVYWIDDDEHCGIITYDGFPMIQHIQSLIDFGTVSEEVWSNAMLGIFPAVKVPFSKKLKQEKLKLTP